MGRKQRQREKDEIAYENKIVSRLREHASLVRKPEALTYSTVGFDTISSYAGFWINSPDTWVNRLKTKNIDKLRLDLVRHVFGIYRCPRFLENTWLSDENSQNKKNNYIKEFVPWYLAVAQGKSLYKECTKGTLSKRETHVFLMAPNEFTIEQNIWWARAYCESNNNIGIAGRVARSNLVSKDSNDEFWISVMRFFVRFPTHVAEMNDLMDFFGYTINENKNYTLKGRSLEAVRKSCEVWHRFLNKQRSIGGGNWEGCPFKDSSYSTGKKEKQIYWTMRQIKTGNDLLKEGQAMHHCVSAYKRPCMDGDNFIWSLSSKDSIGNKKRHLTIQMDKNYNIIQYRGRANRMARPNERSILQRWASDNNIKVSNHYW